MLTTCLTSAAIDCLISSCTLYLPLVRSLTHILSTRSSTSLPVCALPSSSSTTSPPTTMCTPFLRTLAVVLSLLTACTSAQSFTDVTSLQGLLSVWTTPSFYSPSSSSLPSRGCSGAYELSAAGSLSYLTPTPCSTQTDSAFPYNLTAYAPAVGLIRAGPTQDVYYSLFAPTSPSQLFASAPTLLATVSGANGTILSLAPVPSSISASALIVDSQTSLVYLVTVQPQTLTLYVVDPTQVTWAAALHSSVPVSLSSLVPAGASLRLRDAIRTSAFLPVSRRLLLLAGSDSSASLSSSWQLVSVNPATGTWINIALNDSSVLASDTLTVTVLGQTDAVLILSNNAAWVVDLSGLTTSGLAVRMSSVDQHMLRAIASLGCGQIDASVDVLPTTAPSVNSSWPFVLIPMYAQPTGLSAVPAPFWYLLLLDPVLDIVTYVSINAPPLFLGQLTPLPVVNQLSNAASAPLAYDSTTGVTLQWSGSGFVSSGAYTCRTNSSVERARFINSSALQCSLPAGLSNDIVAPSSLGLSSTLPIALLLDNAFVLYQGKLVAASSSQSHTITSSSALQSSIARTVVSYSVAASLTPSPVIASTPGATTFAPTSSQGHVAPLQLHSQLTRGLTYVTQQVLNLSTADSTLRSAQGLLPAFIAALSASDWTQSIGLGDTFALFASGAQATGDDYNSMYMSAQGVLSQDPSSLPQTLSGVQSGGASALSLDLLGSQVQGWLTDTVGETLPTVPDLGSLLNLGAVLPAMSSSSLSQLTSLGLNAVLQQFDDVPVLSDILSDSTVSDLLGLPEQLSNLLDDPTDVVSSLLPGGAIKDAVTSLLNGDEDDLVSFAGSISDTLGGLLDSVGDSVSDLVDTVSDLGSSFADELSGDAVDEDSGSLAGPIGSLAGLLSGVLGASPVVQQLVTSAVDVAGGIGEIYCGNIAGGIGDIFSGIGSLFGLGGSGPDETQQLAQQMTQDFKQVLDGISALSSQAANDTNAILSDLSAVQTNLLRADQQLSTQINQGFGALANLTIAGFTSLQQQQYTYYSSQMQTLSTVLQGISSDTLSLSAATTMLQQLQAQVLSAEAREEANYRNSLINNLEASMTAVQSAISSSETLFASLQLRVLPAISLQQYQQGMLSICNWVTIDSSNNAADVSMSGGSEPTTTLASSITLQPNYDLAVALLPYIVSQYLQQSIPSSLSSVTSPLPNPLAWAFAVNFWMEARQAVLQTPSGDPTNACVKAYWRTGQQLQGYVRLAVAQSTLQAAQARLSVAASAFYTAVQQAVVSQFPSSVPSAQDLSNLLISRNTPGSVFAQFDDACAVATLLFSLAQATGLGSNGFTNGFVNTGSLNPPTPSQSFQPGQASTTLTAFAPVTSTSTFINLFISTVNLTLSRANNVSSTTEQAQQALMLQQASFLLNSTTVAAENAIMAFYPPCMVGRTTASGSLPVIDTTLRRLAGFMVQNQVSFTFQGRTVPILHPAKPISLSQGPASSSSTTSPLQSSSATRVQPSSSSSASRLPASSTPVASSGSAGTSMPATLPPAQGATSSSIVLASTGESSVSNASSSNHTTAIIAGVVAGVAVLLCIIIALSAWCCCRRRKDGKEPTEYGTAGPITTVSRPISSAYPSAIELQRPHQTPSGDTSLGDDPYTSAINSYGGGVNSVDRSAV